MKANEVILEVFQPGKTWEWRFRGSEEAIAEFSAGNRQYIWQAYSHVNSKRPDKWEVQFRLIKDDSDPEDLDMFGTTGTGNSAEVMSIAVDITRQFLQEYGDKVMELTFDAKEPSRRNLYGKMIKRLLPTWDLHVRLNDYTHSMEFHLTNPKAYDTVSEEVLDETTEQDQILVNVADAATRRVITIFAGKESNFLNSKIAFSTDLFISRQDRLTWLSGIRLKDLYLPQVNDPAINQMLQTVKVRMVDSIKDGTPGAMGSYITYENGAKGIELYLPAIVHHAKEIGHVPANQIRSTFIHEMQHALDDVKSAGKFDSKAGQPANKTGDEQAQYLNYLKLPYEINARFTQALLDIALQYNKIEGPYRLQDLIKNAFRNHQLDIVSNKQHKHLASRAYKFFYAMQTKPMKIEPKTLVQRALAWITSQPTAVIK